MRRQPKRGRPLSAASIKRPEEKKKRAGIRKDLKVLGWTSGDVARRVLYPQATVCDWLSGQVTNGPLGIKIVALVEREKRVRGFKD